MEKPNWKLIKLPEKECEELERWLEGRFNCPFNDCVYCTELFDRYFACTHGRSGGPTPCGVYGGPILVEIALSLLEHNNYELKSNNPHDYPRLDLI